MLGPKRAPLRQQLVAVPLSGFDRPQTCRRGLPKGQENMGMMVVLVVSFFQNGRMNRHICNHATADESLLDEA